GDHGVVVACPVESIGAREVHDRVAPRSAVQDVVPAATPQEHPAPPPRPAVHDAAPAETPQEVPAPTAAHDVISAAAERGVVPRAEEHVVDAGTSTAHVGHPTPTNDPVIAEAAGEGVAPGSASKDVVSLPPPNDVTSAETADHVRSLRASEDFALG